VRFRSVEELSINDIQVSRGQARTRAVEDNLDELVESIRVNNQLEPIVVAPLADSPGRYEIITGQRRYLAHMRLGRDKIMAAVISHPVDEATAKALSLSENLIRHEMSQKDLIDACTALYQKYGSVKAAAEEAGLPYQRVRSYVKYERLRPELKALVDSGQVDVQTALRIEDSSHLNGRDVNGSAGDLALKLAGMTRAQQMHFLKTAASQDANGHGPADQDAPPEKVRQVVVTLNESDHGQLRSWARQERLTQDQAAARIIESFLRQLEEK
jgi:ParB family chromosome partitioning protein